MTIDKLYSGNFYIKFQCGFFKRANKEKLENLKKEEGQTLVDKTAPDIEVTAPPSEEESKMDKAEYSDNDQDKAQLIKSNGTNDNQPIIEPETTESPGEEDWGEVDALLDDLGTAPEDVKIETTADIVNENETQDVNKKKSS